MQVLLIEDNESIIEGLEYTISKNGYSFLSKKSVFEARELLRVCKPDIIILDVSFPDGDGFQLYESTIKELKIPTIFLTALDDEESVVKGLDMGADDYITKPFSTKELIARINKIVMRNTKNNIIKVKDIEFDLEKMTVKQNDKVLELTSLEMKILHLLFINMGRVVSREVILEKIWEWTGNDVDDHTITVYIKRIREKLNTEIIITLKGMGYRIDGE